MDGDISGKDSVMRSPENLKWVVQVLIPPKFDPKMESKLFVSLWELAYKCRLGAAATI